MTPATNPLAHVHPFPDRLLANAERRRMQLLKSHVPAERGPQGQFFTPAPTAARLASLFSYDRDQISVLDAGAGTGSLSAAVADHAISAGLSDVSFTAVELDHSLECELNATLADIRSLGYPATAVLDDYVNWSLDINAPLADPGNLFDYIIMNPPYFKIGSKSRHRSLLRQAGFEASNIYAAFLLLAARSLRNGGELVAITPRSFANGRYFRHFRSLFCSMLSFEYIHLFDSRSATFSDSNVLQENIIFRAAKRPPPKSVFITSTAAGESEASTCLPISMQDLIPTRGYDAILQFPVDRVDISALRQVTRLTTSLADLSITASTGQIVEFRNEGQLSSQASTDTVPLLQPANLRAGGRIEWPLKGSHRPQALIPTPETASELMPNGCYVLLKRFTAKEERRRLVAAVTDPDQFPGAALALENHLNVLHRNNAPLDRQVALGLMVYLNSVLADRYFRLGSGHTQVNAADLRRMPYPAESELRKLGEGYAAECATDLDFDQLLLRHVPALAATDCELEVHMTHKRVREAQDILEQLGLPKQQSNERSALTLLALLNMRPRTPWSRASNPMIGVTPIMSFMDQHYGKQYAPNTRETVRRATIHQFQAAGMIEKNPDDPERPINSGRTVYQVTDALLVLLKAYGSDGRPRELADWRAQVPSMLDVMNRNRAMARIPVTLPDGREIRLSPGGQNPLIRAIIETFCPRFTPAGTVLYIGDADEKFAVWEQDALAAIGIQVDSHGKMPDLIVLDQEQRWIIVVEAVTSHGPISDFRRRQLADVFSDATLGIVYVTAFESRAAFTPYVSEISWETEVWLADAPTHLIHFDGKRFLGPYNAEQEKSATT